MTPRATMRLQFHKGFTFADAEQLIPYLARLGISHVYASPVTTARPGSMHGYDVIDPAYVNPELGGEEALKRLVAALRGAGLGLIVDIVPNHMAVGAGNAWWFDVLKQGKASRYAAYFDIDWDSEDACSRGKVLLPVLGKPLREVLRDREITLAREKDGQVAKYFEHRFPISGQVRESDDTAAVLAGQHYRLASWRVANDEINWRRFFDINELAGLRIENPDAFEDVHALIFRLYAEGMIDGVRVDHIDGLADPAAYCRKLRQRLDALTASRPVVAPRGRPYIVVEKILLRGEALAQSWGYDGTSGYDFMNQVSAVQHAAGEPLSALWESVSGRTADFAAEEEAARREIIARSFSAQLDACTASFHRLARAQGYETSRAALRRALIELLAHFPVYRTYATASDRPEQDNPFLAAAIDGARRTGLPMDRDVVDRLGRWLGEQSPDTDAAAIQSAAVVKFQQLSAPVAAKAVEDTAFYRYGRLLSRNDVGFDARRLSDSADDFHANMQRRPATSPNAMLATATHDHKRGEDVRARLAVLSEYAADWAEAVPRWLAQCERKEPSPGDIAILFQMIVGAWPLDLDVRDAAGRSAFAQRLARWQEKALREAKLATDWSCPNGRYENAARDLLMALLARNEIPSALQEIAAFAERIAPAGAVNGLAQTLLKLTVPGIPDIYQGTEFWDFSLVDPDNRRPVDFALRAQAAAKSASEDMILLAKNWRDGRIKQALIAQTLAVRQNHPDLFTKGEYLPLAVTGEHGGRIVAFARRAGPSIAITIVPRTASRLLQPGCIAFESARWVNTAVALQHDLPLVDVFKAAPIEAKSSIRIADLLEGLPFALLLSPDLAPAAVQGVAAPHTNIA
jgi:(1->4)-alpha-D-glucan 1-alpha-D-glucosylmutase